MDSYAISVQHTAGITRADPIIFHIGGPNFYLHHSLNHVIYDTGQVSIEYYYVVTYDTVVARILISDKY